MKSLLAFSKLNSSDIPSGAPLLDEPFNAPLIGLFFTLCLFTLLAIWLWPRGPYFLVISSPMAGGFSAYRAIANTEGAYVSATRFDWAATGYFETVPSLSPLAVDGVFLVLNNPLAVSCLRETSL